MSRQKDIDDVSFAMVPRAESREPEGDEVDEDIDRLLGELRGGADALNVRLYRLAPGSRKEAYIDSIPPEVHCVLEYIKETYGPGDYRVKAYAKGRVRVNESVSIEGPPKAAQAVAAPASTSGVEAILAAMAQQQKDFQNMLIQLMANQREPKADRREMLEEMAMMRNIFGPAQSAPASDPMALFSVFKQGLDMAKELAPREGEAGVADVLMEGMKQFMPVITQAAQRPPMPAALPQQPQPQPQQQQPQEGDDVSFKLKMAVGFLVAQAARDADVGVYADMVLDQVGDDETLAIISAPDWFDKLNALDSRAALYRPWFDRLRAELLSILTPPAGDGTTCATGGQHGTGNADGNFGGGTGHS